MNIDYRNEKRNRFKDHSFPTFALNEIFGVKDFKSSFEKPPQKPSLGGIVLFALGMWASCAAAYYYSQNVEISIIRTFLMWTCFGCVVSWLLFAIYNIVCWRKRRITNSKVLLLLVLIVSVACGLLLGFADAVKVFSSAQEVCNQQNSWTVTLLSDPEDSLYGSTCQAKLKSTDGKSLKATVSFNESVSYLRGAKFQTTGTLTMLDSSSLAYSWSNGICSKLSMSGYSEIAQNPPMSLILDARQTAISAFSQSGGNQAGSLQALACGYKNTIKESGIYDSYKATGLAHLVSVSGAHLAVVVVMITFLGSYLNIHRNILFVLESVLILAYLIFAGVPISAVRATFMVMLALSGPLAGRKNASVNSLALCIIAFLLIDPSTSISVSFFLSAGSTFGIILFASLIQFWLHTKHSKVNELIVQPLALTLSSNIVTQPYSMALFSQLSIIAPIANIICTPLFTVACVASLAAGVVACVAPPLAQFAVLIAKILCFPLEFAVNILASIPYACIAASLSSILGLCISCVLTCVLWVAWPKFRLKAMAVITAIYAISLIVIVAVFPAFNKSTQLIMFDVGQGDSFLLKSGSHAVLIDTGQSDSKLRSALASSGVYSLDAVIISHHDADHMASLESLDSYMQVNAVYCATESLTCGCSNCTTLREYALDVCPNTGLLGLNVGDSITFGSFTLNVIWPASFTDEGGNADSVCLLVETDADLDGQTDWKTLMVGDAENDQLSVMAKYGIVGDIDVLKVGHHGSRVSMSNEALATLKPEIALISVGENNRYGHPKAEALEYLANASAEIFRTDLNGQVTLTYTANSIDVTCDKMAS
jgi:competence protein ComEC